MKKNYFEKIMMITCVLCITGLLGQLSAQERIVNIPAPTAENPRPIDQYIMGDTIMEGDDMGARVDSFNTVYVLERGEGKVYLINSLIQNVDWPLTVVAEDGDGPRPYLFLLAEGTDYCFRPKGDLTLKGLHLSAVDNLGAVAQRILRVSADDLTVTIDDCWFDDVHQSAIRLDNADMSLYITNSTFSNMGNPPDPDNGRFIDLRGNDQDTLVVENCTFYNMTHTVVRNGGGRFIYVKFNNCTFANVGRRGFQLGATAGLDFTNNILHNVGFVPQDTASSQAVLEISPIGQGDLDAGLTQEVNISHNTIYLDTTIFEKWLNDTLVATLLGDSLAMVFIDSNPYAFYNLMVEFNDGAGVAANMAEMVDHQLDPDLVVEDSPDWVNPDPPALGYHVDVPFDFGFTNNKAFGGGPWASQLGDKRWTALQGEFEPVVFEVMEDGFFWSQFSNAGDAPENIGVIPNPNPTGINTSDGVMMFMVQAGADPWAGAVTGAYGLLEFTQEKHHMEMMVHKDVITNSALKVEGGLDGAANVEVKVSNTVTGEWELLTFDFSAAIGKRYTKLVFFPDFPDSRTEGSNCYVDNINIITSPVGIKKEQKGALSVYPNPATDYLRVEYPGMRSAIILDVLGKQVQQQEFSGESSSIIHTQELRSGLYFITVDGDSGSFTSKFIKK
ncbi:MAG: T9SS type A sorting domain-containing protein [Bacteroidales bacterium]